MSMASIFGSVAACGGVGGIVNAFISDNGFALPKRETTSNGVILRPGCLGNVLIGMIAACVSWALYGPVSAVTVVSGNASAQVDGIGLTVGALAGAVLVGVGGARWLTNEVDKKLLKAAASAAASAREPTASPELAGASPAQTLDLVRKLQSRPRD